MDRVRSQEQLVIVTAAVGGAAASFAGGWLQSHSEVLAFLGLLFITLALAVLRQDQEIVNIASHLINRAAFGSHAEAQIRWERHKHDAMQGSGWFRLIATAAQVVGIYGVPVLAYLACAFGTIFVVNANGLAWTILCVSFLLFGIFSVGAVDVFSRYANLGTGPDRSD